MRREYTFSTEVDEAMVDLATTLLGEEEAEHFFKADAICLGVRNDEEKYFTALVFTMISDWCSNHDVDYGEFIEKNLADRTSKAIVKGVDSLYNDSDFLQDTDFE